MTSAALKRSGSVSTKITIGDLLSLCCVINQEQLKVAVHAQNKVAGERLGETFVRLGMAPQEVVDRIVVLQDMMANPQTRGAALEAAMEIRARAMAAVASSIDDLRQARQEIEFLAPPTTSTGG